MQFTFLFPIRSVNFKHKTTDPSKRKIVAEEIIEEIREDESKSTPTAAKLQKANETGITFKKPGASSISNTKGLAFNSLIKRKQPLVVLKPKTAAAEVPLSSSEGNSKTTTAAKDQSDNAASSSNKAPTSNSTSGVGGLSLLSAYSDSSSEESN